ncbi:MAG: AAA family ATPase [Pseudomonadota bacterium]
MYKAYWSLSIKPFENTPDPQFMFNSAKHEEARMRMLYAAHERKEGALLTGEYGSGKTVLSRVLLNTLARDEKYRTVLILNPKVSHSEMLKEILFQLGEPATDGSRMALQYQLGRRLEGLADEDRSAVIIIDEAQVMDANDFNELRLLLNFKRSDRFLFTLLLVGQTDLKEKILSIEPLKQRLAMRYHLSALDEAETAGYIEHRLGIAGRRKLTFSQEASKLVYQGSEGIPRRINNICDYCLLIGFGRKASQISAGIVEDALKDLEENVCEKKEERGKWSGLLKSCAKRLVPTRL